MTDQPAPRPLLARLVAAILIVAAAGVAMARAQAGERIDTPAIAKIRAEGLQRSQAMDTVFWLTDRYGPRLTGSPEFEEAGDWAIARLREWGVSNVRKERFASGAGWSLKAFHATMTAPRVMPIIGMPRAWSRGTRGAVTADVVRVSIATPTDAERYRGQLRGKIVLMQPARPVRMLEYGNGTVVRYGDDSGRWRREAMTPNGSTPIDDEPDAAPVPAPARGPAPFDLMRFFADEGVVAVFDRGATSDLSSGGSDLSWIQQRLDGGTVVLQERATAGDVPQVTLAVEHYNRMARLVERAVPVTVELNVDVAFTDAARQNSFNILGEIPGTDKADEIVLIGAHFDSWHAGTGATDNASGVAAMMEVLRIIKASGLSPRRTIRIGLWGSEESGAWNGAEIGLVGSRVYASEHLGTRAAPKPELAKTSVYFNLDNGTGRIRGVWTQGNAGARQVFEAWAAPLKDLGVDLISPRRVSQTDHVPFDLLGVPAFQFVQERYEYNARTHHTNMDVYDRMQPEDMAQMATVAAVFAWQAATRDQMLPRLPRQPSGRGR